MHQILYLSGAKKGAEMERLTRRSANGTGVYATPSGEPVKWEDNRHNVLQKLADYEDLEEQGRLIKLPCKVGDAVYLIKNSEKIVERKADMMFIGVLWEEFGKEWFPTKAEAEAKLKELRGGENER